MVVLSKRWNTKCTTVHTDDNDIHREGNLNFGVCRTKQPDQDRLIDLSVNRYLHPCYSAIQLAGNLSTLWNGCCRTPYTVWKIFACHHKVIRVVIMKGEEFVTASIIRMKIIIYSWLSPACREGLVRMISLFAPDRIDIVDYPEGFRIIRNCHRVGFIAFKNTRCEFCKFWKISKVCCRTAWVASRIWTCKGIWRLHN